LSEPKGVVSFIGFDRSVKSASGSVHPFDSAIGSLSAMFRLVTASDILWTDFALYRRRYEKSASALVAIQRVLASKRPLGGEENEFLKLYDQVAASDATVFTRVWSDPTAYFWVRLTFEYVGNLLTSRPLSPLAQANAQARGTAGDSRLTLTTQLDDFKRFVLALGVITGRETRFDSPFRVALPFVIPTTNFVIDGSGDLGIHGCVDNEIEVSRQEEKSWLALTPAPKKGAGLCIRETPVATVEDYRLALQPEMFNLAGLEVGAPLQTLPAGFEASQVRLTEQALTAIQRYAPPTYKHFRTIMRSIALKPAKVGNYSNISHSDLPGSFVCSVVNHPYWLADAFVHEFYHNRLFFIEELGPFFASTENDLAARCEYYSPWRDELRSLHGIFHGLYVYLALWKFWMGVYRSGEATGALLAAVKDLILRTYFQVEIGASQLRRFACFTSFGRSLFDGMVEEISRIRSAVRDLRLEEDLIAMTCSDEGVISPAINPADSQAITVRDAVLRHAHKYDISRQCANLEAIVNG
jgi:HEXXH motif-containing protein